MGCTHGESTMPPPHKLLRAPEASPSGTLPAELMLEIVARSDASTLFRCAAACKLLRREILSPAFVRRVCTAPDGIVPPRLLGVLGERTLSIAHAATPAAVSFAEKSLAPFVWWSAGDLLAQYWPQTTRGGLVLLQGASDMCVYDPMTGERTYLPSPPDMDEHRSGRIYSDHRYVLLTSAADGIGCSFLLLAADLYGLQVSPRCIHVRTMLSDAGAKWSAETRVGNPRLPWAAPLCVRGEHGDHEAVVIGGVVHWLVQEYVLTYDVGAAAVGRINFPKRCHLTASDFRLGSTPDGRLRLFGAYRGFTVCSWVMESGGDGWSPRAKVNTLPTLMSLSGGSWEHDNGYDVERFFRRYDDKVEVESIGDQRSGVTLLRLANLVFMLDMDTREICKISGGNKLHGLPLVVDLPSRLSTMKIF